ncbi:MAG: alpha/beta hydrolase [Nocardioides sp.]
MTSPSRPAPLRRRVEALGLRAAMGLPEALQRRLCGGALVRDGQTLSSDTRIMLLLSKLVREPGAEELPIEQGRDHLKRQQAMAGGRQSVGAVHELPVGDLPGRLYVPTGAEPAGPVLLYLHGGGWIYGDLDSHDPTCRFLAERAGVRVLSVGYRLAPEHPFPAAYDDAVDAFRWLVKNAESLGGDPHRLAVGGDSAGACLAATTAIEAAHEGLPLAFQLLIYPGTDMRGGTPSRELFGEGLVLTTKFIDLARQSYVPDPDQWADPRVSPLLADLPRGLAPAYVATGGFDPLRDEGEAYARKLADAGVPVELERFSDQIHGFAQILGVGRTSRAATAEIAAKLRAALSA